MTGKDTRNINNVTSFVMNAIMQIPQPVYDLPVTGDNNSTYFIDFIEE